MYILLLEPDRVLAGHLADYFKGLSHQVIVHTEPQAAINSIDKQRPDLIISELELAGRSGPEFLYELRSYPEWLDIPVFIYTNLSLRRLEDYQPILVQLNVQACLSKTAVGLAQLAEQAGKIPIHAQVQ